MKRGTILRVAGLATILAAGPAYAQGTPPAHPAPADATPAPPPPAGAAPSKEAKEAEERFLRGRQLFDEGDYALALVEFNRAYELSPNYRVLFNIAQINIQLFNYAAARTALERFLRDGGTDIPPARKAQAESDLKMLRARTATITITTNPPADVAIDDVGIGTAPFTSPILINAGQRKITVTRPGFVPITKVVTVAGGDAPRVDIELVAEEKGSEGPKVVTTKSKNYTPATIGWVATGALAIGAGVFGAIYLSKESEIDDLSKPSQFVTPGGRSDAEASATRMAVTADVFGLLAIGAAAVSIYFTLKPPQTESVTVANATASAKPRVRIVPTASGLAGTF